MGEISGALLILVCVFGPLLIVDFLIEVIAPKLGSSIVTA